MSWLTIVLQQQSVLQRTLEDIPRSPAAIFVYLMLIGSMVLIARGSRQKR